MPSSKQTNDEQPQPERSGADLSLIRWMLSMNASERLATLQAQANSMAKLRDAYSGR